MNSSTYLARINNIVEYFDKRYELIAVGTSIADGDIIQNTLSTSGITSYNDDYSKVYVNTNMVLEPGTSKDIYIQFKLDRSAVISILNNNELLDNYAEINSYTTFKNNNLSTPVAVIDRDSVPGNLRPENGATHEDDSDQSTSLLLELRNERAVQGTVFVDSTGKDSNTVYKEQERLGNGIFDSGETTLSGIEVTLRKAENNETAQMWNGNSWVEAKVSTDENGNFEIKGFVPDNYILTYTWGDETYKVQYYKGTIYDASRKQDDPYWYRGSEYGNDTISVDTRKTDALDDYNTRETIDNEMETIKYNTLESEIEKAYKEGSSYIKTTRMNSSTPVMSTSVEYNTTITDGTADEVIFAIKNVDFGIVERPKQALDISKRISGYRIVLPNKVETLVDATIDEDGNISGDIPYTTYLAPSYGELIDIRGQIKTEMDNELIEGSTLETIYTIKVTNVGELDYVSKEYYYYGNSSGSDKVKVSVLGVLDYVDGRLATLDDRWEEKDNAYLEKVNASRKDDTAYINIVRTQLTSKLAKELVPGESNSVGLNVSKLLTSTDDNTFDNEAEIVEVTKVDREFNTGTPVKVSMSGDSTFFSRTNAETIIIIPNTGDNKNFVLPIVIGISALLVLGAGIFVIKKYVIK